MNITVEWLKEKRACVDAVDRASKELDGGLPLAEVIRRLDRADWLIWLLSETNTCNTLQLAKLACICARTALKFVPPDELLPLHAIEAAEAVLENDTPETRHVAADAVREAWTLRGAAEPMVWAMRAAREAAEAASAVRAGAWALAPLATSAVFSAAAAGVAEGVWAARPVQEARAHKEMCNLIRAEIEKPRFRHIG